MCVGDGERHARKPPLINTLRHADIVPGRFILRSRRIRQQFRTRPDTPPNRAQSSSPTFTTAESTHLDAQRSLLCFGSLGRAQVFVSSGSAARNRRQARPQPWRTRTQPHNNKNGALSIPGLDHHDNKQAYTMSFRSSTVTRGAAALLSLLAVAANFAAAADTPSPNQPIPKPACDSSITVSIRYAETTKRLYLESSDGVTRGGCVTLGEIWEDRAGKAPLYAVDAVSGAVSANATGTWLLSEELYVEDGITLQVYGTAAGGDADELRLLSTNETFINLRAHGGSLDFVGTKVFSWDTTTNSPDEDETDGRSYISAISEIVTDLNETCAGMAQNTMGEARMDIESSEIGYLGFQDSESYGLTWKVRGFCEDKSNPEVFDNVNVYGNMYDSDIHHLRFGLYTYGHQQGDWRRNKMHDNSGYGFDPHDDSDFLTIHDNEVYNNGYHGIIASKRCNGVSIQGNEVYGGAETSAGIFLHRSSDDATVKGNYVHDNGDAGMAMLESFGADVSENTFENNKYGVRFSVACGDNVFFNNTIRNSTEFNAYSYLGSDLPETVDSGRSQNNVFSQNTLVGGEESIKIKEADGTQFLDNVFEDAVAVRFDNATMNLMQGNAGLDLEGGAFELTVINGACFDGASDAGYEPVC